MTHNATPVQPRASSLQSRRVDQTRSEVYEAAIPLFLEQGFDETSMSEVADAAGVSRRTLYRYFATKDDILFERPRQWLAVLDDVLGDRQPYEPLRTLVRRGLAAVAAAIAEDAEMVMAGFTVLSTTPSLAGRHGRSDRDWVERYVEFMTPEVVGHGGDPHEMLVTAMALVAAQNAVIITWAANHPAISVTSLMARTLDQVDPIWPEATRTPPRS